MLTAFFLNVLFFGSIWYVLVVFFFSIDIKLLSVLFILHYWNCGKVKNVVSINIFQMVRNARICLEDRVFQTRKCMPALKSHHLRTLCDLLELKPWTWPERCNVIGAILDKPVFWLLGNLIGWGKKKIKRQLKWYNTTQYNVWLASYV